MIPQIIMICLLTGGFTVNAVNHDKPREDPKYDVGGAALRLAVFVALLWWGGFWDVFWE